MGLPPILNRSRSVCSSSSSKNRGRADRFGTQSPQCDIRAGSPPDVVRQFPSERQHWHLAAFPVSIDAHACRRTHSPIRIAVHRATRPDAFRRWKRSRVYGRSVAKRHPRAVDCGNRSTRIGMLLRRDFPGQQPYVRGRVSGPRTKVCRTFDRSSIRRWRFIGPDGAATW